MYLHTYVFIYVPMYIAHVVISLFAWLSPVGCARVGGGIDVGVDAGIGIGIGIGIVAVSVGLRKRCMHSFTGHGRQHRDWPSINPGLRGAPSIGVKLALHSQDPMPMPSLQPLFASHARASAPVFRPAAQLSLLVLFLCPQRSLEVPRDFPKSVSRPPRSHSPSTYLIMSNVRVSRFVRYDAMPYPKVAPIASTRASSAT